MIIFRFLSKKEYRNEEFLQYIKDYVVVYVEAYLNRDDKLKVLQELYNQIYNKNIDFYKVCVDAIERCTIEITEDYINFEVLENNRVDSVSVIEILKFINDGILGIINVPILTSIREKFNDSYISKLYSVYITNAIFQR